MASLIETIFISFVFVGCFRLTLSSNDEFHEELFIKPLPNGYVYNHFQFTTTWNVSLTDPKSFQHYHLFPKALGEVLVEYSVQELHLSLSQGLWRYDNWGYPIEDAPPGAQVWVWFQPGTQNVDSVWTELINVLSGMFCASLNFMDAKATVIPKVAFRPRGVTPKHSLYDRFSEKNIRYAALPRENVCTENLTPWKKLLPCGARAGLLSLMSAVKLYDANYHSLGLHFRPVCMDAECSHPGVELSQTLAAVFEPPRVTGSADWNFRQVFGRMMSSVCAVASSSKVYVDLSANKSTNSYTLSPEPDAVEVVTRGRIKIHYAVYNPSSHMSTSKLFNLGVKYSQGLVYVKPQPPVLHATTFQTGFGQDKGGVMTLVYNNHPREEMTVAYMQVVPWFCRTYLHTLTVQNFASFGDAAVGNNGTDLKPLFQHYVPGQDRQKPYHLELVLTLPANSVTRVGFEFERALLKWTEYPPDANHGFYINSATISAVVTTAKQYTTPSATSARISSLFTDKSSLWFVRLQTESLLITLPTPDFSMPYNVICLACTVVAIAFGSIHNLTTRRFIVKDPNKPTGLLSKVKALFKRKEHKVASKMPIETVKSKDVGKLAMTHSPLVDAGEREVEEMDVDS